MRHIPIRLGPLALLLTVITICMTTLSVLSYANSAADMRLSERYAETVRIRYALERDGQLYLRDHPAGDITQDIEKEGYILHIPRRGGTVDVWKFEKLWNEETEIRDLWKGDGE